METDQQPGSWLEASRHALRAFQPFAFRSAITRKLERMAISTANDDVSRGLCASLPSFDNGVLPYSNVLHYDEKSLVMVLSKFIKFSMHCPFTLLTA